MTKKNHGRNSAMLTLPNQKVHSSANTLVKKLVLYMNCTAILITLCFLQVAAHSNGQGKITYSGKDVRLEQVLDAVTAQSGYRFFYKSTQFKDTRKVSLEVKDASVEEVMKKLLDGLPFTYTIDGKFVFIEYKKVPAVGALSDYKRINVKGKLVNKNKEPVVGATVTVKGTSKATVSDEKGEFLITDVEDNATLSITNVNYETQEVNINGREELSLELDIKMKSLTEVSVSISTGYQQISKEKATGSFSHVDNKLLNRSVSPDILSRIKGVASGVLFDQSADNNIGISIRGRSTIYGNTQPLIILNNLPFQGDINDINPNDVESITILKDAAASSMWGALSGNGVIVITTKKGKNNQSAKLNFNTNVTIKEKPDLFYNQQFMNPSDFIDLEIDLFKNGWYNGDLASGMFNPVSPVVDLLDKRAHGLISSNDSASQIDALRQYDIRNDYTKYFYRPSVLQQYYLNLSGGNNNSTYSISAGYDKDLQTIRYNKSDRFTLNSQMTFMPVHNLEITGGIMLSLLNSTTNGIPSISSSGKNLNIYPYARLADDNGKALPVIKTFSTAFVNNLPATGLLDWSYIPLNEHNYTNNTGKNTNTRINASIKYTIVPSLNVMVSYFRQSTNGRSESLADESAYSTRNLINQFSVVSGGVVTNRNVPLGAILSNQVTETLSNSGRGQINYNKNFALHNITAITGIDIIDTKTTSSVSQIFGYDKNTGTSIGVNFQQRYPTYPYGNLSTIIGRPNVLPYTQDRFRSYFGNLSYSYDDKYFFTLSGKLDQSNLFGVKTNQKSIPLWSAGTRWNIFKENFYNIEWLSQLSLRSSYGFNGNYDKSVSAMSIIEYTPDNINGQSYSIITSPGNPQLRWEKIGIFNIALEFQTKSAVLSGSIEYYRKKGIDMIGNSALPSSSGFYMLKGNYSNMKASGLDFVLNTQNIRGVINWSSNILVSYAANKVTKNEGRNLQLVGRPVQGIYVYKWGGLDPSNGDPLGYNADTLTKNYTVIISETSADPTKYIYAGSASPRLFGAIRNTITWKGLSLSANITFKAGYYFLRSSLSYSSLINFGLAHKDYENRWKIKGDESRTNVPSFNFPVDADRDNFYQRSEINVEKGDHIRLQDINLSYDIIASKSKIVPFINQLKVYAYINNIGLIWKANDKGIDPDFVNGLVTPRSYSIGLNMTF